MIFKRFLDILFVIITLVILSIPIIIISLLVFSSSKRPILFWSDRVGIYNSIFKMPKFRTMKINTPPLATHLLSSSDKYVTKVGSFLRKISLDELPQLWSILKGDMTFVGPRQALFNQYDLIELRKKNGVDILKPGITGWAQINGRDNITIEEKVNLDIYYLKNKSFFLDFKIIILTLIKVIIKDGISH